MTKLANFYVACCAQAKVKTRLSELKIGDIVQIVPDPSNPHDSAAVTCHVGTIWLGYVPATLTSCIHPYFRQDKSISGRLVEINKEAGIKELLRVQIDVDEVLAADQPSEYIKNMDEDARRAEFLNDLYDAGLRLPEWEQGFVESCKSRKSYTDKQRFHIDKIRHTYIDRVNEFLQEGPDDD